MFNLLVRVRCTSFPEIRVMCLLTCTLAFLFCVKYPSRLCSFESKKFWNLHFFLRTHYRQMARGSMLTWTGGAVQILLSCFASSLFFIPPFHPFLSSYCFFWRFSARRRLVTASQQLLFRWKYRRRSSFLVSTPQNKSKAANSPKGHLYYIVGRKFLFK